MKRGSCKICAKPCVSKGKVNGIQKYRSVCSTCLENRKRSGIYYFQYKKDKCEFCGFIPVHSCQLSIDHKDGDRRNNKEDNLQTLCHNCHFLKSYLNKDYIH